MVFVTRILRLGFVHHYALAMPVKIHHEGNERENGTEPDLGTVLLFKYLIYNKSYSEQRHAKPRIFKSFDHYLN